MRIETTTRTLYTFDELPEDIKEKAIEKCYYINIDCGWDWWENVYEDAENIGLKIEAFDIDRGSYVRGKLTDYTLNVAEKVLKDHGEMTETYKLAEQYIQDRKERTTKLMAEQCQYESECLCVPGYDIEEIEWGYHEIDENDYEEINVEFERALKEEYLSILRREYDYLTSEEAIIETIQANEYEFDEDGNLA